MSTDFLAHIGELIAAALAGRVMQPKAAAWIGRYLAHLRTERRLSPHTEAAYRRDLDALVAFCDGEKIADWKRIDNFHVRTFAAREHRDGLGPRSVQRRLSALRGFFNYLIREKALESNPAVDIRAPKAAKRLPKTLDVDQVASLLARKPTDALSCRDLAMLELLYSSGLRLAELAGLDVTDLDLADRTVRVLGKGSKTRVLPVGGKAVDGAAHLARRAPGAREGRDRRPLRRQERPPARRARDPEAHRPLGGGERPQRARAPAPPAPFLRDAPARVEPRPARRAGTPGTRGHQYDAGLHAP